MNNLHRSSTGTHALRDQRTIEKYLTTYSEPEARWSNVQLDLLPPAGWDYVVTVPACGEDRYLPGALQSINQCQVVQNQMRVLCIVVLNGNESREAEFKASNIKMRSWFGKHCEELATSINPEGSCSQKLFSWRKIEILVIDRSVEPWLIPSDQGVGLVRKIAADLALYLITAGKVKHPWIHATDADAIVPNDYFIRTDELIGEFTDSNSAASCVIYPYRHIPDPDMSADDYRRYWTALAEYELWLRYYVAGLQWAESSYAYPSIGSLLAFDALAYARIRGFPKRMAGEDFYFRNKLAKVGSMIMLEGEPIELLTRPSNRVPFGTGQGTISIEQLHEAGDIYEVYHPSVFDFLKDFLAAARAWLQSPMQTDEQRQVSLCGTLETALPVEFAHHATAREWLQTLLTEMQVFRNLNAAEQRSKSVAGAIQQFDDWFDSFRTLKLIHRLRDDVCGRVPLLHALDSAIFLSAADAQTVDESSREQWLFRLRDKAGVSNDY